MRSSVCGAGFSITFFFTLHLLLCSSAMARSNRPRPLFTTEAARARAAAAGSRASDPAITLGAPGGAGDDGGVLASSAQDDPVSGLVGSTDPETTATNLDPSVIYTPLDYSDLIYAPLYYLDPEDMSVTGFINALQGNVGDGPGGEDPQPPVTTAMNLDPSLCCAPKKQDFAAPSMAELAELFNDSSVEEEMKGGVAARPCSDDSLHNNAADIKLENYIKRRVWEMLGSNGVGENIQPKFPPKN